MLSGGGVLGGNMADAKAGDTNPIGVKEQVLGYKLFGSALVEVSLYCGERFRPQGTSAMFSAFAEKVDLRGPLQTEIAEFKLNDLTDPGAGVVEQQKQCPVTEGRVRVDVYRIEDGLHFRFVEVVERSVLGAFERDSADFLALG